MQFFSIIIFLIYYTSTLLAFVDLSFEDRLFFEQNDGGAFYKDQCNHAHLDGIIELKYNPILLHFETYAIFALSQDTQSQGNQVYNTNNSLMEYVLFAFQKKTYDANVFFASSMLDSNKIEHTFAGGEAKWKPKKHIDIRLKEEWFEQNVDDMEYPANKSHWNQISPEIRFSPFKKKGYLYLKYEYQHYNYTSTEFNENTSESYRQTDTDNFQRIRFGFASYVMSATKLSGFIEKGAYIQENSNKFWGNFSALIFTDLFPQTPLRPKFNTNIIFTGKNAPHAASSEFAVLGYVRRNKLVKPAIYISPFIGYSSRFNANVWERKWLGWKLFLGLNSKFFMDIQQKHYWYNNVEARNKIIASASYKIFRTMVLQFSYTHWRSIGYPYENKRGQLRIGFGHVIDPEDMQRFGL